MGLLDALAVGAASGFGNAAKDSLAQSQKDDAQNQLMQTKAAIDLKNQLIASHDAIDYKTQNDDAQRAQYAQRLTDATNTLATSRAASDFAPANQRIADLEAAGTPLSDSDKASIVAAQSAAADGYKNDRGVRLAAIEQSGDLGPQGLLQSVLASNQIDATERGYAHQTDMQMQNERFMAAQSAKQQQAALDQIEARTGDNSKTNGLNVAIQSGAQTLKDLSSELSSNNNYLSNLHPKLADGTVNPEFVAVNNHIADLRKAYVNTLASNEHLKKQIIEGAGLKSYEPPPEPVVVPPPPPLDKGKRPPLGSLTLPSNSAILPSQPAVDNSSNAPNTYSD